MNAKVQWKCLPDDSIDSNGDGHAIHAFAARSPGPRWFGSCSSFPWRSFHRPPPSRWSTPSRRRGLTPGRGRPARPAARAAVELRSRPPRRTGSMVRQHERRPMAGSQQLLCFGAGRPAGRNARRSAALAISNPYGRRTRKGEANPQ